MSKVFKLVDPIRTFYGVSNRTYRQALDAGEAKIEARPNIYKKGLPTEYIFRENGKPVVQPIDGRQAKKWLQDHNQ